MTTPLRRRHTFLLALAILSGCTSTSGEHVAVPTSGAMANSETTASGGSTSSTAVSTLVTEPATTIGPSTTDTPIASEEELSAIALADRLSVDRLSVWTPRADDSPPEVIAVTGDTASTLEIGEGWAWADDLFIYVSFYNEGGPPGSSVVEYDGTIVCELFGQVHHATARADGTIVVAVDTTDYTQEPAVATAVAHDCATGTRQPIESWIQESGESEYLITERVGGRVFQFQSDAEGNAQATNETGISINGDDYAGDHVFTADGGVVVYADFTNLIHVSRSLRARDTTTGELLWSVELDRPYISLTVADDRVLVGIPVEKDDAYYLDETTPESVLVLDLADGHRADEVASDLQIIGAG